MNESGYICRSFELTGPAKHKTGKTHLKLVYIYDNKIPNSCFRKIMLQFFNTGSYRAGQSINWYTMEKMG